MSYDTEKAFDHPKTRHVVGYLVRLLHMLLAVHWSKPLVISKVDYLVLMFYYDMATFLSRNVTSIS